MVLIRVFGFVMLVAALQAAAFAAMAEPLRCPQRIAFVDSDPATRRQAEEMKLIYARIGCPDVAFVGLPGRRGVVAFNTGEVQGELMRVPAVEPEYTRAFVRVRSPIVHVVGRLWGRDAPPNGNDAFGFVLGVIWQERYGHAHGGTGYHGQTELMRAYATGLIDHFLAEDPAVAAAVKDGRLPARPAHAGPPLVSTALHHYLGVEFAAAAAAVANELERQVEDAAGPAIQ
ncbi:hypothetical protein [Ferrovibrio terrae]|uniref:hypothetical protein n=1 Tax=Ferrovibrio terrae TaxID=2594003 RepID=UPI003137D24D